MTLDFLRPLVLKVNLWVIGYTGQILSPYQQCNTTLKETVHLLNHLTVSINRSCCLARAANKQVLFG